MAILAALFAGLPIVGFMIHRWSALLLPPVAWLALYLGDDQGWWGDAGAGENALAVAVGLAILNMLTTTVGILLGQIYADRTRRVAAEDDT